MKNSVLFSVMLAGAATCLASTSVVSTSNAIGLMQVSDTDKEFLLVAVPWLDYGTGEAPIAIADLIRTATLTPGDKLYVGKSGGYDVYELGQDKKWAAANTVTINQDGTISDTETPSAGSRTVQRGDAVWLKRSGKNAFYILGQKPDVATVEVNVAKGLNLVASPSADGLVLASGITGSLVGDEIIVNGNTGEAAHYYYCVPTEGGNARWCKAVKNGIRKTYVATTSETIPAGTGFWYKRTADTAGKISL